MAEQPTARVLFVDDEPLVLASLQRLLRRVDDWQQVYESDPRLAWELIQSEAFDAVVLDVRMPVLNGLELLDRIKQRPATRDLPVLILTGEGDRMLKRDALLKGAHDFLTKPIDSEELKARLAAALRLKFYEDELKRQNENLAQMVRERTRQLSESRLDIIWRLAKAAEYRDEETGNHVVRVGGYSRVIAEALGRGQEFVETIYITAPLHDIGKIGIPDAVLLKPGKLTPDEWQMMKQHCAIGAKILSEDSKAMAGFVRWRGVGRDDGSPRPGDKTLRMACTIAMSHHEKWDGSGYPSGLKGEAIPLPGRIVAISDVFDALVSSRPYKRAFSVDKALSIIREGRGAHFDPAVHDTFMACFDEIRAIRAEFSDPTQFDTATSTRPDLS